MIQKNKGDSKRTFCSVQGLWTSELAAVGSGSWLPGDQNSRISLIHCEEPEVTTKIPLLEALPQTQPPYRSPWLLTSPLFPHYVHIFSPAMIFH
jgi:hypothetical protein